MLIVRIEIDTESFLAHAREQEATTEELRQYVAQELRRKIEKMSPQIAWMMMAEGAEIKLSVVDPYKEVTDEDTL